MTTRFVTRSLFPQIAPDAPLRRDSLAQQNARRRYNASAKGRDSRRRYATTPKGQAAQRKAKERWNAANAHKVAEASRRRFAAVTERVNAIKLASGCVDCGYNAHPAALDFDHAGSEKVANVSTLIRRATWDVIAAEIAKCVVVCANCHRIRTVNERRAQ